jgi:hypothetical protein
MFREARDCSAARAARRYARTMRNITAATAQTKVPEGADVYAFAAHNFYFTCPVGRQAPWWRQGRDVGGGGLALTYDDCATCHALALSSDDPKYVPASICTSQHLNNPPRVYVHRDGLPPADKYGGTGTFRYDDVCYFINRAWPRTHPPPDATRLDEPSYDYADCAKCTGGVLARLCDGNPRPEKAPQVWVPRFFLEGDDGEPIVGVRYFRVKGWCYQVAADYPDVDKPDGAIISAAPATFIDCPIVCAGCPATTASG